MNNKPYLLQVSNAVLIFVLGALFLVMPNESVQAQTSTRLVSKATGPAMSPDQLQDLAVNLANYRASAERNNSLSSDEIIARIFMVKTIDRNVRKEGYPLDLAISRAYESLEVFVEDELDTSLQSVNAPLIRQELEDALF